MTISAPLRLRLTGAATAPAVAAWLVPGADAGAWLAVCLEVARSIGASPRDVGLFILPGDPALGALIVPPSSPPRGITRPADEPPGVALASTPSIDARAQPYGRFGGRLYLPAEARLEPPLSPAEVEGLAASDVLLLHPSAGLVGFGPADRRGVLDLVQAPPRTRAAWRALPRPLAPLRLAHVVVHEPPTVTVFLSGGGEGLGAAPPSELPPAPSEKPPPGWLTRHMAKAVEWATGGPDEPAPPAEPGEQTPPPSSAPATGGGMLDRLRDWSKSALALEGERTRELERLLHLLGTDPDQGLRYALPLGGRPAGGASGAPPAGVRLPPRRIDFDPTRERGGAGDPWAIDAELHRRLVEKYREVADRELRLGRFRRAAYVYAELLSDPASAASALEQGRFFREAAAIHRDTLGKPVAAARCLERGGLLVEAAELFERERQHIDAGDCWSRLERREDAARCYRRAVDARLAANDPASAARLVETKLGAPDEAQAMLGATWPDHPQAGLCLEDLFALWGRLGRHDAAARRLAGLRDDERRRGRELTLARALGASAARYPDHDVQARAQDLVRVVVGERLPLAGPLEADALAQALTRLDPGDRLLARDAGRALAERRKPVPRVSTPPETTRRVRRVGWGVILRRELLPQASGLPASMEALAGAAGAGGVVVVGRVPGGQHLALLRSTWSGGATQSLQWSVAWPTGGAVLLDAPASPGAPIVVAGSRRLPPRTLARTDDLPGPLDAGSPVWLPDRSLALASNDQGVLWVLYVADGDQVVLSHVDAGDGHLIGTQALPIEATAEQLREDPDLRLVGRREGAYLAAGNLIVRLAGGAPETVASFERPALELAAPVDPLARHLAVGFEDGAALVVPDEVDVDLLAIRFDGVPDALDPDAGGDEREGLEEPAEDAAEVTGFGGGLVEPRLGFTRDGLLVAMTAEEGRVYLVEEGRPVHKGTFDGPGQPVVAVLATDLPREVAVVLRTGVIRILGVTRE